MLAVAVGLATWYGTSMASPSFMLSFALGLFSVYLANEFELFLSALQWTRKDPTSVDTCARLHVQVPRKCVYMRRHLLIKQAIFK
jgi:hypothetical protein